MENIHFTLSDIITICSMVVGLFGTIIGLYKYFANQLQGLKKHVDDSLKEYDDKYSEKIDDIEKELYYQKGKMGDTYNK